MDGSDNMAATMDELDELGNLFEFGDIDLNNLPDVTATSFGEQMQSQQVPSHPGTHPSTPFRDLGDASLLPDSAATDFAAGQAQMSMMQGMEGQQHYLSQQAAHIPSSSAYMPEGAYQPAVTQPHPNGDYHYHGQQAYPPAHHIPPTPNSYEMHGRAAQFTTQPPQQQYYRPTMEQQRYQMQNKNGQIAFTPMASPAGTPQFNMLPEFTTPGAYSFSPLNSPMMHAQNSQQAYAHAQHMTSHPNTAPSSNAPSPNDSSRDVEMSGSGAIQEMPNRRKSRRKMPTPKSAPSTGRPKASPVTKAQKRKNTSKASETDLRRAVTSQPSTGSLRHLDSSEAESISPEPLNEVLMAPPPRPGSSLEGSQHAHLQESGADGRMMGPAATPKSLLQRRGGQHTPNGQNGTPSVQQSTGELGGLDDLALPEAARPPAPPQLDTQVSPATDEQETPRASARKTPKVDASHTSSSSGRASALPSPAIGRSPATVASTPAVILKDQKDGKGGRGPKKRPSTSQSGSKNLPRISPSIKPLLPEGSPLNSSTHALLLASKSNYQNILEGNHLPGVNYPDSLSTGLTSKRTSHKVAEQGRRNRINEALKEMQLLVPKPSPTTKAAMKEAAAAAAAEASNECSGSPDGDKEESAAAKSSNSKAATVELANEYIRRMQREFAEREAVVEELRRENDALKRRLGESEAGSSCGGDERMEGTSPPGETEAAVA